MKILDRFTLRNLEEVIGTIFSSLPHLTKSMREVLVRIMPYTAVGLGVLYIASGLLPYVRTPFFMPSEQSFILNGLLLRLAAILTGLILIFAFRHLKLKMQKGWDSLWFVSIFQVFFGLLAFHMSTVVVILTMWYVLFEIKKEYHTSI